MNGKLANVETMLAHIERLAEDLRADPDGHVRRSVAELRTAFAERRPVEPAVTRMRDSVQMLSRDNREGARREFQRRATGLAHLGEIIEQDLMPQLRQLGFEV